MRKFTAAAAAATSIATLGLLGATPIAHADPAFTNSLAGVGSDTIQSVADALAGGPLNGQTYNAITSLNDSGNVTISSFDAIAPAGGTASQPGSITTKLGGSTFDRPDGSGNGQDALSHAIDPTASRNSWMASGAQTSATGKPVNVAGQIDFARSSGGAKVSGSALSLIPYARDAVSYAYIGSGLSALTTAQLKAAYSGTSTTVGGITIKPCIPQFGSGTRSFFLSALGVADLSAGDSVDQNAKAAGCDNVEENGFDGGLTSAGTGAVVPFSSAAYIAQQNGYAPNALGTGPNGAYQQGFFLGSPNGTSPYNGTVPTAPATSPTNTLTPNSTFYSSSTFGRQVYFVVPSSEIGNGSNLNFAVDELFYNDPNGNVNGNAYTPAICTGAAQTIATEFGFDKLANISGAPACGSIAATGGLYELSANT